MLRPTYLKPTCFLAVCCLQACAAKTSASASNPLGSNGNSAEVTSASLGVPIYDNQDAVLMSQLSQIVYQYGAATHAYYQSPDDFQNDLPRMNQQAQALGYTMDTYSLPTVTNSFGSNEMFAAIFENADRYVLAYRGTVYTSLPTLLTDDDWLGTSLPWGQGHVHEGFLGLEEGLWPMVQTFFSDPSHQGKPLWVTGHSLGAALATLGASKIVHQLPNITLEKAFVYGVPRVGDPDFMQGFLADGLEQRFIKFSHYNDLVNAMPFAMLGYCDTRNVIWLGQDNNLTHRDANYSLVAIGKMDADLLVNTLASITNAGPLSSADLDSMEQVITAVTGLPITTTPSSDGVLHFLATELNAVASSHDIKTYIQVLSGQN